MGIELFLQRVAARPDPRTPEERAADQACEDFYYRLKACKTPAEEQALWDEHEERVYGPHDRKAAEARRRRQAESPPAQKGLL